MRNLMIIIAAASMLICQQTPAQNSTLHFTISASMSNSENVSELIWVTQKEVNSSYFIIERSQDNLKYIPISTVKAAGYSLISKTYTFEDPDSEPSWCYYRVVLVSMEGERICSSPLKSVLMDENTLLTKK